MTDLVSDIAELERIVDRVRSIRSRNCEPKANTNARYLALSNAVTNLNRAIVDLRADT